MDGAWPAAAEQGGMLVRARNARGDSAALYGFFDRYAKFVTP